MIQKIFFGTCALITIIAIFGFFTSELKAQTPDDRRIRLSQMRETCSVYTRVSLLEIPTDCYIFFQKYGTYEDGSLR